MTAHTPRHSPCVEVPNPEAAACLGKEAFDSMVFAEQVARRMRRKWKEPLEAFRCRECNKIHVGGKVK